MQLQKNELIKVPLALAMYTALIGIPGLPLPIWRALNILVNIQFATSRLRISSFSLLFLCATQIFPFYLLIQALFIDQTYYAVFSAFGMSLVFALSFFVISTFADSNHFIVRSIRFSALALFAYQAFQICAYIVGRVDLIRLLNDPVILDKSNALRLVGVMFGAQGFMAESGHVALFVGPVLMILHILNHYQLMKTSKSTLICLYFSLLMTLSGGAFLQIIFISILLLCLRSSLRTKLLVFASMVLALSVVFVFLTDYVGLLQYKMVTSFSENNSRVSDAQVFMRIFYSSYLFGIGPTAIKQVIADPNYLIPVFLATYGLIGAVSIFIIVVCIPYVVFVRSRTKLFITPIIATFTHLCLAYGTIVWPFIWVNYAVSLFGLSLWSITGSRTRLTDSPNGNAK